MTLRARFPNPQGLLLPGMFVRASFAQAIDPNAFLVPATGGDARSQGRCDASIVVGPDNKAVAARGHHDAHAGRTGSSPRGLKPGRQDHHPRHRQGEARPADQAGRRRIAAATPSAARHEAAARAGRHGQGAAERGHADLAIFIDRPIFAWVIAIIIMLGGIGRDLQPAGRAISRRRAAAGQHPRELSRRVGRNAREQRRRR